VVFVQGVLDRGRSFSRVAGLLSPRCRVLWYDRRGYGASADAPGVPADIDVHIGDLVTVLDGRPAVLVGHSFGGVVAAGAAVRVPETVETLVLYESVTGWAPEWDDRMLRQLLCGAGAEEAGLRLIIREERSTRAAVPPYDVAGLQVPLVYGFSVEFVTMTGGHKAHRTAPEAFGGLIRRGLQRRRRS
jgi:pimeloyl-ACP methyl ester carboxylesterase